MIPVADIVELDENHWYAFEGQVPTCRSILEHVKLIDEADLSYPIILDSGGHVMDGMHRVCKAVIQGASELKAVQFIDTPSPDYIGCRPDELPYD